MFGFFSEIESNVRLYCRDIPILFDRARGEILYSHDDKPYLDFLAGAGSLNYGHNDPDIIASLVSYIDRGGVVSSLDLHTKAKYNFLEIFKRLILKPLGLSYKVQFTGPSGANAIEASFQLARKVLGRPTIYAFYNSYHGMSLGALAATYSRSKRRAAGIPLDYVKFLPYGDDISCDGSLSELRSALRKDPGAVVLEVIQGEAGALVASKSWLKGVRDLCTEFSVPMIVDDIQAGCGRTGDFFSFTQYGIEPDIITLSKSLSGLGLPLSVVLIRPDYDIWEPGEHTGTFRGNNFAFVTAHRAVQKFWETDALSKHIISCSEIIDDRLRDIKLSSGNVTKVTGQGLIRGIHFVNSDVAKSARTKALERGLICETTGPSGAAIKLLPPLIISHEHLRSGLDTLAEAISDVPY